MSALERGAADFVVKPMSRSGESSAQSQLQGIIDRVVALGAARPRAASAPEAAPTASKSTQPAPPPSSGLRAVSRSLAREFAERQPPTPVPGPDDRKSLAVRDKTKEWPVGDLPLAQKQVEIIGLGTSTGGPQALLQLIPALPADLSVPVVVVQHMPAGFTKSLAESIDKRSHLMCREAEDGDPLKPGIVLVAPGGRHMVVERSAGGGGVARLHDDPPEHSCRPAVDVLFRSLEQHFGASALGAVLTGMGEDGAAGAAAMRKAGAVVLAQDEATSVVWGMPARCVECDGADRVVPLSAVAPMLARIVERSQGRRGAQDQRR